MENFTIRDFTGSNVKHIVYMDGAYTNSNPSAVVNPADEKAKIRYFTFENVGGSSTSTAYRMEGFSSTNPLEHIIIRGGELARTYSEFTNCVDVSVNDGCTAEWSKGTDKNKKTVVNDKIFIDGEERTDLY